MKQSTIIAVLIFVLIFITAGLTQAQDQEKHNDEFIPIPSIEGADAEDHVTLSITVSTTKMEDIVGMLIKYTVKARKSCDMTVYGEYIEVLYSKDKQYHCCSEGDTVASFTKVAECRKFLIETLSYDHLSL